MTSLIRQSLGWLHLSDIHLLNAHGWRDNSILRSLKEDIAAQKQAGRVVDFVVVTGDIAFGAKGGEKLVDQYEAARQFFDDVLARCGLGQDRLFLVPGNHDIDRKLVPEMLTEYLRSPKRDITAINQLVQDRKPEFTQALLRLQAYQTFIEQNYPHLLPLDPLLGFTHLLAIGPWKIALSGLNSAWTCVDNFDTGQMWLAGQTQLEYQHERLATLLAGDKPDLRLALIHHPLACLHPSEEKTMRASIENSFDLLLHGHAHDAWVKPGSIPGHSVISAGAATAETAGEFGYNWVEIGSDGGKVFLHRYDEAGAGWAMQTVSGRAPEGVWALPNTRLPEPAKTAHTPSNAAIPTNTATSNLNDSTALPEGFADARSTPEQLAQLVFGRLSVNTRYQESNSREHYFRRTSDEQLSQLLAERRWVLVEGHPLAGKTRAVFEALRQLLAKEPGCVVWAYKPPAQTGSALPSLLIPAFPAHARLRVVWFDDFDQILYGLKERGYKAVVINQYLAALAEADCILLASARTGPQNYALQRRFGLDDRLWERVETILIPKLAGAEAQGFGEWYQQQFSTPLPDKFDHHPGSLFLNLNAMRERWDSMQELAEQASANGLDVQADHARELLQALYLFYTLQAWQAGGLFSVATIKKLLTFRAKFGEEHGNKMALALKKHQPTLLSEWDNVVEFLAQDRFHLGFIETVQQDGQAWLQIETAYLDYIIGPGSNKNLVQKALEQLDATQRQQLGLRLTPYNLATLLPAKIHNEDELRRLLRSLKALGLVPDLVGWNQIIHHCNGLGLAQQALQQCQNSGIAPDVFTFSSLLDKAANLEQGQHILQLMRDANVSPNVVTFSSLLDKAANLEQGQHILQLMRDANVSPDLITWTSLFKRAENFKHCELVLQLMQASECVPNSDTWNALLARVFDVYEGQQMLQLMRAAGISPNEISYSILFKKAKVVEEIAVVWETMQIDQVPFFQYHLKKVQDKLQAAGTPKATELLADLTQRIQLA
jgi:predicted MPP superfamily phosphohydrolase